GTTPPAARPASRAPDAPAPTRPPRARRGARGASCPLPPVEAVGEGRPRGPLPHLPAGRDPQRGVAHELGAPTREHADLRQPPPALGPAHVEDGVQRTHRLDGDGVLPEPGEG